LYSIEWDIKKEINTMKNPCLIISPYSSQDVFF
jgi:hypothetical protein